MATTRGLGGQWQTVFFGLEPHHSRLLYAPRSWPAAKCAVFVNPSRSCPGGAEYRVARPYDPAHPGKSLAPLAQGCRSNTRQAAAAALTEARRLGCTRRG